MNSITISGNLGKDPETKNIGGAELTTFSIADRQGKDVTYWHNCEAWNQTAENIAKYFKKGDKIIIVGTLLMQEYEKDGVKKIIPKIRVNQFDFGGGGAKTEQAETKKTTKNNDNDVPF